MWLLSATEALATFVNEHADVLKAIATILVDEGLKVRIVLEGNTCLWFLH